ncbi:MAG: sterol desaturase family protein [Planctomycetes bacterium]|nr:sterol desaturase family protein [Planctomycetota bacterium]
MPIDPTNGLSITRPAVAAVVLALLWIIEAVAPQYVGREHRGRHGITHLAMALINSVVIAVPFATLVYAVCSWAQREHFGLVHVVTMPQWAQWLMVLVLFDMWMYGWHRLNHRVPLLWRFHSVHHTDRAMEATSALRFHTGEVALSSTARLAVLPLLGMTVQQLLVYETILLPVILFHHSNIRVPRRLDDLLRWLIVTPWMHWVHHSRCRVETDSNYSSVLSIWDRCFGTYRLREDPERIQQGLDDADGGAHWRKLGELLIHPFRHGAGLRPRKHRPSKTRDHNNSCKVFTSGDDSSS